MMKHWIRKSLAVALAAGAIAAPQLSFAGPKTQKITFVEDDAQKVMASKVYILKHIQAADLIPFVKDAVMRYATESHVSSVNDFANKRQMLIVSTGENFLPYLDKLIAVLDRPSKMNTFGSTVDGDGVATGFYRPRFRTSESMRQVIIQGEVFGGYSDGAIYLDNGVFYYKDSPAIVQDITQKLSWFDKEIPQVKLELKVYEIRESDLRDVGIDYLAWKNGPGMNLFSVAYEELSVKVSEFLVDQISQHGTDLLGNMSWGFGGFYTAPAFDASFIRLLQQNGKAVISSSAALTLSNEPGKTFAISFAPEYQNITKDQDDHHSDVVKSESAALQTVFSNIVITSGQQGAVNFNYKLTGNNVVERNNYGAEISEKTSVESHSLLAMGQEKVLTSWTRNTRVDQTIGIPFLCEIPILKYLFGTTTTNIEKNHYFVTARAIPVKYNDNVKPGIVTEFKDVVCKQQK